MPCVGLLPASRVFREEARGVKMAFFNRWRAVAGAAADFSAWKAVVAEREVFLSSLLYASPALVPFLLLSALSVGPFSPGISRLHWYLHCRGLQQRGPGAPPRFPTEPWDQHRPHRPGPCQGIYYIPIICLPIWNLDWIPTLRSRRLCAYVGDFSVDTVAW